ncbi:MAG: hypothetical protein NTV38_07890 [Chloroflexi bacterium]|nr:hypothetical protein [Chloroflexota bacterium]
MDGRKKLFRTLSTIFFSVGVLLGMVMFIFMNWAYFEAIYYFGYNAHPEKTLTTLRCPLLMTTADQGAVTLSLTNSTDRDLPFLVSTEFSYFDAATLDRTTYPFKAGETRTLSWPVASDNIAFGHLILARVYVYSAYTLPSLGSTCGTGVVDLHRITGIELFILVLAASLVGMAVGWGFWFAANRPLQADGIISRRAMSFFTALVVIGLVAGLIGWWGLGIICAAGCLLLIISVVGYYVQKASQ